MGCRFKAASALVSDRVRDRTRSKRNRDERFDTVNCDRTRDREGQIAHEYVSPPFTDGDRHSLSSNQCGQGQVYIGTVTTDRTAALLPKVQSSADATS